MINTKSNIKEISVYDILRDKSTYPIHFVGWKQLYRRYYIGKGPIKTERLETLAKAIITKYMELAVNDILENGVTVGFHVDDEPYMALSIRDFKNVSHGYRWRSKFRGHYYKAYARLSPELERKMKPALVFPWLRYGAGYTRLSKLVQAGKDYDEVPYHPTNYSKDLSEVKEYIPVFEGERAKEIMRLDPPKNV